ncbi:uncharacterized protein [Nerophis lumbriciformis]|uniref:uncharacterized protein n=1 Tax=Nerophis lumbriciformis TaxID=546530 RepID=UPI002AE0809F|nr:aurora kinase-like [Nerophis lumbriciformis]
MDDDKPSSSDSNSENKDFTILVEDCGVGPLSNYVPLPSTSDPKEVADDSGQFERNNWKADAKSQNKTVKMKQSWHRLHMSVKTKGTKRLETKSKRNGTGVMAKGARSRSTEKRETLINMAGGSKKAPEYAPKKQKSKPQEGCLTVKNTRGNYGKETEILTKNDKGTTTDRSTKSVRSKGTRRKSGTNPETDTMRLSGKDNEESMKSASSKGKKRTLNTEPQTLTKKPGDKHSEDSKKAMLVKGTRRKFSPEPATFQKKPTEGLVKSGSIKRMKTISSAKPETFVNKPRTQSSKVCEEGETKCTDILMERCVKTLPATLDTLLRDQSGIPTKLSLVFFGEKKTETSSERSDVIPPRYNDPSTTQQVATNRALFAQKYHQLEKLGEGGFGSVYAGYRKTDYFPVAIKYIPKEVKCVLLNINGLKKDIPVEALLMLQASIKKNSKGQSAVVSLLNKYDLEHDIVLVMERPVPSVDLFTYITRCRLGTLQEYEAQNIMKQLVDAAINMHAVNVFHRDLKQENILLEATSGVPRVRIIDFGCSCFASNGPYQNYNGTQCYAPPEYVLRQTYSAGPTTVWHLGALLFELMAGTKRFDTTMFLSQMLRLNRVLSEECEDFLWKCLNLDPEKRATLEQMQQHPWLI